MKSEDLRMLSEEEKIDLKIGRRLLNLISSLILISDLTFSQIPINGFTNFTEVGIISQQNKIFSLNYNKDSYSDLLVYSQEYKSAYLLTGQPNLNFLKAQKINFRYEPNFFKPIYDFRNQISDYAFTSRKSRIFGLLNFNRYGFPIISKSIKLSSFPNKVDLSDVNLDNITDFVISGEAFNGLSIIYQNNNKLIEKNFLKNHSFLDAAFFDINGDEYIDILAYDLITQKLLFIYNKDGERFEYGRELKIDEDVFKFQIIDINFDGYKDIIFATNSGLLIYYGDNLNVFDNSIKVRTNSAINNFAFGDFNRDGFFDFITYSQSANYLSVIFSDEGNKFFDEIIYDYGKTVNDLIPFFSKFVYGVSYIKEDGQINIISEFSSFKKDINFIYGIQPTALKNFDFNNNGLLDFVFIDRFDNKLKFILRDNQGVPSNYFQIELKGKHSEIFILRKNSNEVDIYSYSYNERLVEVISINFNNYRFKKDFLYTEGNIQDLQAIELNNSVEIKILYSVNNKLNYGTYSLSLDKKYKPVRFPIVSENFKTAKLVSDDKHKILLWKDYNDSMNVYLVEYLFDTKSEKLVFSSQSNSVKKIFNFNLKQVTTLDYFSLVINTYDKYYLIIFDKEFNLLSKSELFSNTSILNAENLITDSDGILYLFDSNSNIVYRILNLKTLNKLLVTSIYSGVKLNEFVVSKLDK
jgi:hypothetical protein